MPAQEAKCNVTVQTLAIREPKQAVIAKPSPTMTQYIKTLYIKDYLKGRPVFRVLIDNGFTINVMPIRMVRALGKNRR